MQTETVQALLELNQRFYQTFGRAFAATRRRIQPGVRHVLKTLPPGGCWLDLGCGSGALAAALLVEGKTGIYVGMDFSQELLDEARRLVQSLPVGGLNVRLLRGDLGSPQWHVSLGSERFDAVWAFAVLHHLPSYQLRVQVMKAVRSLLKPGGSFIHSEWQFQHSPRLMERRQDWERVGIAGSSLEEGDTLLDWRHALPGQTQTAGLRYVHLFSREELSRLAADSGFIQLKEFESDGRGGRLALYQYWRAA